MQGHDSGIFLQYRSTGSHRRVRDNQAATYHVHTSQQCTDASHIKPEGGESKEQEQQRREAEAKAIENLPKWILFHELAFTTKEYMKLLPH